MVAELRAVVPVRRAWLFGIVREFQVWAGGIGDETEATLRQKISMLPAARTALETLLLRGLVAEVWDRFSARQRAAVGDPVDLVGEAQQYLERHYAEHITIATVAHSLGCSRACLTRAFRAKLSRSFHDYLTELRVRRAVAALRGSADKVEVIATMVGYKSKKDLYRSIRMRTGATPNAIRAAVNRPGVPGRR